MDVSQVVQTALQTVTAGVLVGVGKIVWSTSMALASLKSAFDKHEEKDDLLEGIILGELRELRRNLNGTPEDPA